MLLFSSFFLRSNLVLIKLPILLFRGAQNIPLLVALLFQSSHIPTNEIMARPNLHSPSNIHRISVSFFRSNIDKREFSSQEYLSTEIINYKIRKWARIKNSTFV